MNAPPHMIAIVAMTPNRVIGKNGRIPWHISEDLRWFKEKTMGGILLMGRKTYESIGRPLPGRETWVISRTAEIPDVHMVRDPTVFQFDVSGPPIFIVGGAEIYRQMLPRCSDVFVTEVALEVEGDTFMPEFEKDFPNVSTIREGENFRILHYRR